MSTASMAGTILAPSLRGLDVVCPMLLRRSGAAAGRGLATPGASREKAQMSLGRLIGRRVAQDPGSRSKMTSGAGRGNLAKYSGGTGRNSGNFCGRPMSVSKPGQSHPSSREYALEGLNCPRTPKILGKMARKVHLQAMGRRSKRFDDILSRRRGTGSVSASNVAQRDIVSEVRSKRARAQMAGGWFSA